MDTDTLLKEIENGAPEKMAAGMSELIGSLRYQSLTNSIDEFMAMDFSNARWDAYRNHASLKTFIVCLKNHTTLVIDKCPENRSFLEDYFIQERVAYLLRQAATNIMYALPPPVTEWEELTKRLTNQYSDREKAEYGNQLRSTLKSIYEDQYLAEIQSSEYLEKRRAMSAYVVEMSIKENMRQVLFREGLIDHGAMRELFAKNFLREEYELFQIRSIIES